MSVPWVHTLPLPPPPPRTRPPVLGMWKQTPALGADTPWKEHGTRLTGSDIIAPLPCERTKASENITFSFGW